MAFFGPRSKLAEALPRLEALLVELRAKAEVARGPAEKVLARVLEAKHDDRLRPAAGRALDLIASRRLYRVLGHRSMSALLRAAGISRTTAHRWRALGRVKSAPGPRRRRPGTVTERALADARLASEGVEAWLRRNRLQAPVDVVVHEEHVRVRVLFPIHVARKFG